MGETPPRPDGASSFGELLRQYRRAANLTQEELAERAHMAARSIRALEHGERRAPYRTTVASLATALDLDVHQHSLFQAAAMASRALAHPPASAVRPVPVVPHYALSTHVPLVGRGAELRTIVSQLHGVNDGCQVLLLGSDAGGGKTRLLAEVAARMRDAGAITLAGGCYEQEGRLPYGPIHDALLDYVRAQPEAILDDHTAGILPDVARLLPELRERITMLPEARDGEGERQRLFAAVASFIERISATQPLLLILDDLQWSDDATLGLAHYLIRQLGTRPVLLAGAYREDEVVTGTALAQFISEVGGILPGRTLRIHPLSIADLNLLLVERLRGQCAPGLVATLHSRSGGNPFFSLQMLRLLQQEAALVEGADGWQMLPGTSVELPFEVRDTIARRFHGLPQDVRETLTAGAILGRAFSYHALAALWHVEEIALDRTLDAAAEVHLLIETSDGYVFRHPLLREVIYNEIPRQRRVRWHARAGLALESLYGSTAPDHASELAQHFAAAGEPFRAPATRYLTLAGDAACQAFSWEEAREYYTRAASLATTDASAAEAEGKLGLVLKILARYEDSLDALGRAAHGYELQGRYDDVARTLASAGATYLSSGRVAEGTARLERELKRMEQLASPQALALAYGALAGLYHLQTRHAEQHTVAERALALARESGDKRTIGDASAVLALALINQGRLEQARTLLDGALEAAEAAVDQGTEILILNNLAWIADTRGEPEQSARYLEQAGTLARRYGNSAQLIFILHAQGRHAFWRGDWPTAERLFEQATALDAQAGQSWASPYLHLWRGRLSLARGDVNAGIAHLRACLEVAGQNADAQVIFQARCFLAEHDLSLGQCERARDNLLALLADTDSGTDDIGAARALPLLAWAHLGRGETGMAEEAARRAVTIAQNQGYREALITALQVQGEVLADRGRDAEAEVSLAEALHLARVMRFPLHEASILRALGNLAARAGKQDQGQQAMTAALTIYRRLGAAREIRRTEENIKPPTNGPRPVP